MLSSISRAALLALLVPTLSVAQTNYELVRELRIGAVDGEQALTAPGPTVFFDDGSIAVLQPAEAHVKVFGPDGRLRTILGRRGGGPGEFGTLIIAAGTHSPGKIWVADGSNRRLTIFELSGKLDGEISWPGTSRFPAHVLAGGEFFAGGDITESPLAAGGDTLWAMRRYDRTGSLVDTIAVLRLARPVFVDGRRFQTPLVDGDLTMYSRTGDRLVIVSRPIARGEQRPTFSVIWVDLPGGDTLRRASFSYEPVPVTDEYITRFTGSQPNVPSEWARNARQALLDQRFFPPVSAAALTDPDVVWVGREQNPARPTIRWYRITLQDGMTGYVDLPASSRIVAGRGPILIVSERDQLDVPYIARYRVQGLQAGRS